MHEHSSQAADEGRVDATPTDPVGEGDVLSLIDDVNRHLERIRNVQSRQESDFADLSERQRRLAADEAALETRRLELADAAEAVARSRAESEAVRAAVEVERDECRARSSELQDREAACETARAEFEQVRTALEERDRELDRRAGEVADADEAVRERMDDLEGRERLLGARIEDAERGRDEAVQALERAEAAVAERESELTASRESVESLERSWEDRRVAFEDALRERDEELAAARECADRHHDAMSQIDGELQAARAENDGIRTEIADLRARLATETAREQTIETLEARCRELEEASANERDRLEAAVEDAARRIAELEARTTEDQRQLKLAGSKLAELARVVSEQASRLERGAEALALVGELEAEIERLRNASPSSAKAAEIRAPLEARLVELEEELERMREAAATVDPDADVVPRSRHEEVKERCRRAERRGLELETALSMANDRGQAQEMAKRLRARAERVGEISKHLERRRDRLAAMRTALRRRAASVAEDGGEPSSFHELQRLESQRQELAQVRDFLARSERQMVRRWARPRAVATLAWTMIVLAVSVAAGWFTVTNLVPGAGVASVALHASTVGGRPLDPEPAQAWEDWHRALATDPAFVQVVTERLTARGMAPEGGEATVRTMLAEDLVFENEGRGRLRLLLSGDDARVLEPTLDAIATSMASESARQAPRRIDGARAVLPTERATSGGLGYASLVNTPWDREVLARMGVVSGAVFGTATLLILLVYLVLSRSKRVFEAAEGGEDLELAH